MDCEHGEAFTPEGECCLQCPPEERLCEDYGREFDVSAMDPCLRWLVAHRHFTPNLEGDPYVRLCLWMTCWLPLTPPPTSHSECNADFVYECRKVATGPGCEPRESAQSSGPTAGSPAVWPCTS